MSVVSGSVRRDDKNENAQTKASPRAEEMALMKRKTDMTRERMFFGAFMKAYSRPVIDARISENAIRTYLRGRSIKSRHQHEELGNIRAGLDPYIQRRDNLDPILVGAGGGTVPARIGLRMKLDEC